MGELLERFLYHNGGRANRRGLTAMWAAVADGRGWHSDKEKRGFEAYPAVGEEFPPGRQIEDADDAAVREGRADAQNFDANHQVAE